MKRTTIYLDAETEVLLKLESVRRGQPAAELIREAIRAYLAERPGQLPAGRGRFQSGRRQTAARAEEVLRDTGFGQDD